MDAGAIGQLSRAQAVGEGIDAQYCQGLPGEGELRVGARRTVPLGQRPNGHRDRRGGCEGQDNQNQGHAIAGKSLAQVGKRHGNETRSGGVQGNANEAQRNDGLVEHEKHGAEAEGPEEGTGS